MERPLASIIIRCHNEERHIGRLLSGILQQTVRDVEIIIVDSGSTDATVTRGYGLKFSVMNNLLGSSTLTILGISGWNKNV